VLELGGSIADASDPRLPQYNKCYLAALGYVPIYGTAENAPKNAEERETYIDICHKLAASSQKLSWRVGLGVITEGQPAGIAGAGATTTRVELYSGVAVWAPSPFITTNVIYQHVRIPLAVDTFGAGLSVGMNVGGPASGVDAWARLGFDALGFYQRAADGTGGHESSWQARLGLTLRGRIAGGAFTTVNIGPRILGNGGSDVDLLSTVSLSYDVDQLFMDVSVPVPLVPAAAPPPPK